MKDLFSNIRFYIICLSIFLSVLIFVRDSSSYQGARFIAEITQHYALAAFFFLYITLMASPLTRFFTFLPYRGMYLKARRALGVSTFYFALLHASFAFFGELGGLSNILLLNTQYLIAVSFGLIALLIFTLMAGTANEQMVEKLTFSKWKMLHRLVYPAAILVLIHATLIGSHFSNISEVVPIIIYLAVLFLLILEAIRFVKYLKNR